MGIFNGIGFHCHKPPPIINKLQSKINMLHKVLFLCKDDAILVIAVNRSAIIDNDNLFA
jgi:hypothetical protein